MSLLFRGEIRMFTFTHSPKESSLKITNPKIEQTPMEQNHQMMRCLIIDIINMKVNPLGI
ncbi:hypothetical protein B9T65_23160 [Serratia marcescens]|nr:hypothetical protein AR325_24110 [Serratia marcescens]PHI44825.1 hypothetical protein B9T65_23160 [Serratia marcescens]RYM60776.1 hypothetical protein BSQ98_19090 [Serratia liquefaciens]